jgi:hypothetical protein
MKGKKDLKSIYRIREEKRLKFINQCEGLYLYIFTYILLGYYYEDNFTST